MLELINEILAKRKATPEDAMKAFDSLPPATSEFMYGRWKGFEIETGHPMDGFLVPSGWYGKLFVNNEDVHPLVFFGSDKKELFSLNPKYRLYKKEKNFPVLLCCEKEKSSEEAVRRTS